MVCDGEDMKVRTFGEPIWKSCNVLLQFYSVCTEGIGVPEMSIVNLYSKQRQAAKVKRVGYRYDIFPNALRTQILTIFGQVVGHESILSGNCAAVEVYSKAEQILCNEYATSSLVGFDASNPL